MVNKAETSVVVAAAALVVAGKITNSLKGGCTSTNVSSISTHMSYNSSFHTTFAAAAVAVSGHRRRRRRHSRAQRRHTST